LRLSDGSHLAFGALRNLLSGNPIGASQVTAVVKRTDGIDDGPAYCVAMRARLIAPYFIRLRDPEPVEVGHSTAHVHGQLEAMPLSHQSFLSAQSAG
jgi:hypothetical protein